jgi:hypothetical protein
LRLFKHGYVEKKNSRFFCLYKIERAQQEQQQLMQICHRNDAEGKSFKALTSVFLSTGTP